MSSVIRIAEKRCLRFFRGAEGTSPEELLHAARVLLWVRLVHTPPSLGFALTRLAGLLLRDVVLTRDEVDGLMAGLLTSGAKPTGTTKLGDCPAENSGVLGQRYVSELRRNYRR